MGEGRGAPETVPALVLRVCDMFYVSGPAASTVAAFIALSGGWAVAA